MPSLERQIHVIDVASNGAIEAFIRQTVGALFPHVRTCKMGMADQATVAPNTWRVPAVHGLHPSRRPRQIPNLVAGQKSRHGFQRFVAHMMLYALSIHLGHLG